MLAAAAVMWSYTLLRGRAGFTISQALSRRSVTLNILGGSFFGPFVGVWLSLVAVQLTHVGVASTLMALAPIFMLPMGYYIFHEKISWRVALGTIVAVTGVSLLFLF
jgi:drug/metabolite transporter (DMT)-like permease